MMRYFAIFAFAVLITHNPYCYAAGIALDGSVGNAGKLDLAGPDYQIKAEYGKQAGANLFHSFLRFDIGKGESATFSGPDSVKNIISRITGGSASRIDGRIASEIPNADLYLLNPAGFMFGPDASSDLSGSFHVSTADYLRMGVNERFYSKPMANEVLSLAAPTAFGFLNDNNSAEPSSAKVGNGIITVEGKGEITEQEWEDHPTGLFVSQEKAISLIGGDIEIRKGSFFKTQKIDDGMPVVDKNGNPVMKATNLPSIVAPGGQICLVSIASEGESGIGNPGSGIGIFGKMGNITLSEKSLIRVSGIRGGEVNIVAGRFVTDDSIIAANNYSDKDNGRGVVIAADVMEIRNGGKISVNANGAGPSGNINILVRDKFDISGENAEGETSAIENTSILGKGGMIGIKAGQLNMEKGAIINSGTYCDAPAGDMSIRVDDVMKISGESSSGEVSKISSDTYEQGKGGNIELTANRVFLEKGGQICSASYSYGDGGNIRIPKSGSVSISGAGSSGKVASGIYTDTQNTGDLAGKGGEIELKTNRLDIDKGGQISATTFGKGQGGNIHIRSDDSVMIRGRGESFYSAIISNAAGKTRNAGNGGIIELSAKELNLSDYGAISASAFGPGKGGDIFVSSGQTFVTDNGQITSGSQVSEGGDAGNVNIAAKDMLINNGYVVTETKRSDGGNISMTISGDLHLIGGKITTSVRSEAGNGGNITIGNPNFISLNHSRIIADAHGGRGGNIRIEADNFIPSFASVISASSGLGIAYDGTIEIDSSDPNLSGSLVVLPGNYLDVSRWASTICDERSQEHISRLLIRRYFVRPEP